MFRAGLLVLEQAPGTSPTIYAYDALGRAVSVSHHGGARTTTIHYETVFGLADNITTTGGGATTAEARTYYPPGHASAGRLTTSTVDTLTTYSTWTLRGELRAQWGASYPVKYEYDDAGRLAKMWTYRTDPTGTNPATSNPETQQRPA